MDHSQLSSRHFQDLIPTPTLTFPGNFCSLPKPLLSWDGTWVQEQPAGGRLRPLPLKQTECQPQACLTPELACGLEVLATGPT